MQNKRSYIIFVHNFISKCKLEIKRSKHSMNLFTKICIMLKCCSFLFYRNGSTINCVGTLETTAEWIHYMCHLNIFGYRILCYTTSKCWLDIENKFFVLCTTWSVYMWWMLHFLVNITIEITVSTCARDMCRFEFVIDDNMSGFGLE